MIEQTTLQEYAGETCSCGAVLYFEDVMAERACLGLCSSKKPDMIVLTLSCDCKDELPEQLPCPYKCGTVLKFCEDKKGRWVANHQYCSERSEKRGY